MSAGKYNIQKKSEIRRFLVENGYSLLRTTKHEIWGKSGHHVSLPTGKGSKVNPILASRLVKEILQLQTKGVENEVEG